MANVTGAFGIGAAFDALVVDPLSAGSPIDLEDADGPLEAFQKWLQLGDDRNTAAVWVDGREVFERESALREGMPPPERGAASSTTVDFLPKRARRE